jgi:hypothetical protein
MNELLGITSIPGILTKFRCMINYTEYICLTYHFISHSPSYQVKHPLLLLVLSLSLLLNPKRPLNINLPSQLMLQLLEPRIHPILPRTYPIPEILVAFRPQHGKRECPLLRFPQSTAYPVYFQPFLVEIGRSERPFRGRARVEREGFDVVGCGGVVE